MSITLPNPILHAFFFNPRQTISGFARPAPGPAQGLPSLPGSAHPMARSATPRSGLAGEAASGPPKVTGIQLHAPSRPSQSQRNPALPHTTQRGPAPPDSGHPTPPRQSPDTVRHYEARSYEIQTVASTKERSCGTRPRPDACLDLLTYPHPHPCYIPLLHTNHTFVACLASLPVASPRRCEAPRAAQHAAL